MFNLSFNECPLTRVHINIVLFNQPRFDPETGRNSYGREAAPFCLFDHVTTFGNVTLIDHSEGSKPGPRLLGSRLRLSRAPSWAPQFI